MGVPLTVLPEVKVLGTFVICGVSGMKEVEELSPNDGAAPSSSRCVWHVHAEVFRRLSEVELLKGSTYVCMSGLNTFAGPLRFDVVPAFSQHSLKAHE